MKCYVLHLEGEEALMDCMMASNFDAADHWIKMGKRREPKNLMTLLHNWTPAQALVELNGFDSDLVPLLDCKGEPSNCWALPVVSLTSITIAVVFSSGTNHNLRERLMKCVQEAMVYIRFVEEKLDQDGSLTTLRKAAQIVWVRVDLHYKWLDLDLRKMGKKGEEETPGIILKSLSAEAKRRYIEYKNKDAAAIFLAESPSKWPPKILAANSIYRICQSLLQLLPLESAENQDWQSSNKIMFERLSNMIAGACLTNLPHIICTLCHQSSMEEREKSVRLATMLLGKAGKILEFLSYKPLPSACRTRLTHIDDWRALSKQMDNQWHCNSRRSRTHKNKAPAGCSSDLYLTIE
ncbi:unnamed protein product [Cuscuta europaea]|uniref:Uncharacterized protein n=1 Tax=Cuscuta europaea TaxID=41803 RepID=A0A9P1EL54_CUSEU|nr:unnamed protein product [Cuscuta europaea]